MNVKLYDNPSILSILNRGNDFEVSFDFKKLLDLVVFHLALLQFFFFLFLISFGFTYVHAI